MHKDSFDFIYNAEGDYYDLVVDKKIQKVVEELKALPHDVLIRYLTYWSEAIDSRKYVVESDLPHEEWCTDCCDYAASETHKVRIENTYGRKQNKALSDILSPHIPYKNLEYEQKEKI